jgi:hypothetical protein
LYISDIATENIARMASAETKEATLTTRLQQSAAQARCLALGNFLLSANYLEQLCAPVIGAPENTDLKFAGAA